MRAQFAALLALAAPLYAITITSPSKNDEVDLSAGVTLKWSTVSTDPTTAHLYLVNMAAGHTPYNKDLGEVDLSTGSLVVTLKDVPADEGYQFNFESTSTQNTGILAQSEQFEVKASGDSDDDSSSSSTATSGTATSAATTSKTAASTTGTSATASVTETATTLSTVSSSATGSATASATRAASTSTSTGAAAPTGMAVQGGSLIALVAGVAAVLA